MKKLLLIFILCALSLYGIMFCYADMQSNTYHFMEDLPLALKYEPVEDLMQIDAYYKELQSILTQQQLNLNTLNYIYYMGAYQGTFDGKGLYNSLKWDEPFAEKASLFNNSVYQSYYKARTEKILKQYQRSETFDYAAFTKAGRQEFDLNIKETLKNQATKEETIIFLQSKLADKLIELEPTQRKAMFDEILAIRQTANSSKAMDYMFQLFESRVRLQLSREMVELNKEKLEWLVENVGIVITSQVNGQLLLQSKDAQNADQAVLIMNVLENGEGYRGLAFLNELFSKQEYVMNFEEENGNVHEIQLEDAIGAIGLDENGYLHLNLDLLLINNSEGEGAESPINSNSTVDGADPLKPLELLYIGKTKVSQEIIKELNRYSIYLELKDKKISNYYTRNFETNQKLWKKNLESKLSSFGTGGAADFMAYLKQFELLDRNENKTNEERILIVKFRNSDIQFRKTAEGSVWIMNMLFRLKTMQ